MKTHLLKNLYSQLRDFGLNSQEWIIQPISKGLFVIYNNEDPTFKFLGKSNSQSWDHIWLHSI